MVSKKTYVEPPMKFDIALKKFVPDLPQKLSHKKSNKNETMWAVLLIIVVLVLLLCIIIYFAHKSGTYP